MKKKNVLMMALSLTLVAVIAVGGTLAYLTADTGTLTNTFQFTTNGIDLTLAETAAQGEGYTADATSANAGSNSEGIHYTNIVPGAAISKEPKLTVAQNSVDCYVYAYVTGVDEETSSNIYTVWGDKWDEVEDFDGTSGTLLKYNNKVAATETASASKELDAIFTKVYVNDSLTGTVTFENIVIEGYAIQADAANADYEAIKYFNPETEVMPQA